MGTESSYINPGVSIDGQRLMQSQRYYQDLGYVDTQTPWVVSKDAYYATRPEGSVDWSTPTGGYMVASGEQGFIQLLLNRVDISQSGQAARLQTTTPCYRAEDRYDKLHHSYFYKLELLSLSDSRSELDFVISSAKAWFDSISKEKTSIIETSAGFDIESSEGVELGSYGFREILGLPAFIYGTGHAEPRWSDHAS